MSSLGRVPESALTCHCHCHCYCTGWHINLPVLLGSITPFAFAHWLSFWPGPICVLCVWCVLCVPKSRVHRTLPLWPCLTLFSESRLGIMSATMKRFIHMILYNWTETISIKIYIFIDMNCLYFHIAIDINMFALLFSGHFITITNLFIFSRTSDNKRKDFFKRKISKLN